MADIINNNPGPEREVVVEREPRQGLGTGAIIAIAVVIILLLLLLFGRGLFGGTKTSSGTSGGTTTNVTGGTSTK